MDRMDVQCVSWADHGKSWLVRVRNVKSMGRIQDRRRASQEESGRRKEQHSSHQCWVNRESLGRKQKPLAVVFAVFCDKAHKISSFLYCYKLSSQI